MYSDVHIACSATTARNYIIEEIIGNQFCNSEAPKGAGKPVPRENCRKIFLTLFDDF